MPLAVVPITDQEPGYWNEMRMSVFGGACQLNWRFARFLIQSGAKRRTRAFCSSVPSRNEIEIDAPLFHLLPLTRAALAAPVDGGAAANHAKHHLLSELTSLLLMIGLLPNRRLLAMRVLLNTTISSWIKAKNYR